MRLRSRIRHALQSRSQVSLGQLLADHPLQHGLAELVAYLSLASEDNRALIDDAAPQCVTWTDPQGRRRAANMPMVLFSR